MHEELKREFEEKFAKTEMDTLVIDCDFNDVWQWFESKLPKEVDIEINPKWKHYHCPNCDDYVIKDSPFCPNCGAKINWK